MDFKCIHVDFHLMQSRMSLECVSAILKAKYWRQNYHQMCTYKMSTHSFERRKKKVVANRNRINIMHKYTFN